MNLVWKDGKVSAAEPADVASAEEDLESRAVAPLSEPVLIGNEEVALPEHTSPAPEETNDLTPAEGSELGGRPSDALDDTDREDASKDAQTVSSSNDSDAGTSNGWEDKPTQENITVSSPGEIIFSKETIESVCAETLAELAGDDNTEDVSAPAVTTSAESHTLTSPQTAVASSGPSVAEPLRATEPQRLAPANMELSAESEKRKFCGKALPLIADETFLVSPVIPTADSTAIRMRRPIPALNDLSFSETVFDNELVGPYSEETRFKKSKRMSKGAAFQLNSSVYVPELKKTGVITEEKNGGWKFVKFDGSPIKVDKNNKSRGKWCRAGEMMLDGAASEATGPNSTFNKYLPDPSVGNGTQRTLPMEMRTITAAEIWPPATMSSLETPFSVSDDFLEGFETQDYWE